MVWDLSDDETRWVAAARMGDLGAFDHLVERYRPAVALLVHRIVPCRELAEDAVQETFLSAYRHLPQLSADDRFAGWLAAIARNVARRLAKAPKAEQADWDAVDRLVLGRLTALRREHDRDHEIRAHAAQTESAIADLPAETRDALHLYYLAGWSVKQIASFHQVPESTVKWRLFDGRKRLRSTMGEALEPYDG